MRRVKQQRFVAGLKGATTTGGDRARGDMHLSMQQHTYTNTDKRLKKVTRNLLGAEPQGVATRSRGDICLFQQLVQSRQKLLSIPKKEIL
jgi:hypothetical protein